MPQELEITSVTVGALLEKLRTREWLIPAFQRDFVWSIGDVSDLVYSILERRPIGMATLWQQADTSELPLEPVSIPDHGGSAELTEADETSARKYAVLDGRQRCTAIAMAFGGLRPDDRRLKFCGRFFLNLAARDESRRIEYVKEADAEKRGLTSDSSAIGTGLFPLSSSNPNETLLQQWYRYTQSIQDPENYANSRLPDPEELEHRNRVLERSFDGLMATKLAVNIVPSSYSLPDVCEIFEVLNTTGTKVSTVDLIHSWLFSETSDGPSPIYLREWMDKIGEQPGAVGWSSSTDRPELIAQMTTAAYVSLAPNASKPPARSVGRVHQPREVTSVKSGDLLATPTLHWKNVIAHQQELIDFLGAFQQCVSGGAFPWKACPYPATASIYVGLRWHFRFDVDDARPWDIHDLDALFRAFFWRNALSSRYDQGFLTQLGADISLLKLILNDRSSFPEFDEWATAANERLDAFMNKPIPDSIQLRDLCSSRQTGAIQKALLLPVLTKANRDLLRRNVDISFPARTDIQLHHIYPRAWCRDNLPDDSVDGLDPNDSVKDWVGAAANLMPLSRESNLEWRSGSPGAILHQRNIAYASYSDLFADVFITEEAFGHLSNGAAGIPNFWKSRADTLASHLETLLDVATQP